ncbi:MAG: thioredoxin [Anaerolineae bacterium]
MANLTALNSENFEEKVLQASKPVLVDFWASWCPPCRALAPTLEELAEEMKDELEIMKVDVQTSSDLSAHYDVLNIPTMILFKDGEAVTRIVGNRSKRALKRELQKFL